MRSTLASLGTCVRGFEDYSILTHLAEELDAGWAIGWRGEGVEGVQHTLNTGTFPGAERVHRYGRGVYMDVTPHSSSVRKSCQNALRYCTSYAAFFDGNVGDRMRDLLLEGKLGPLLSTVKPRLDLKKKVAFLQFGLVFLGQYPQKLDRNSAQADSSAEFGSIDPDFCHPDANEAGGPGCE